MHINKTLISPGLSTIKRNNTKGERQSRSLNIGLADGFHLADICNLRVLNLYATLIFRSREIEKNLQKQKIIQTI